MRNRWFAIILDKDTDDNAAMYNLLVDEQKELIRNILFSSSNLAAITIRFVFLSRYSRLC